ncbi:MAG: hypothetical protein M0D57_20810 [Sphingobacteriales bacterium JAD_PAG50586_3]|nr:MAG: hypothetical protein M0D57_20810 [Sphingobacteriales bacterium JAD_PAG50586_3]
MLRNTIILAIIISSFTVRGQILPLISEDEYYKVYEDYYYTESGLFIFEKPNKVDVNWGKDIWKFINEDTLFTPADRAFMSTQHADSSFLWKKSVVGNEVIKSDDIRYLALKALIDTMFALPVDERFPYMKENDDKFIYVFTSLSRPLFTLNKKYCVVVLNEYNSPLGAKYDALVLEFKDGEWKEVKYYYRLRA